MVVEIEVNKDPIKPRYYEVQQFMKLSGAGRTYTYDLLRKGKLKAVKMGRKTLITAESIEAFFQSLPEFGGDND